MLAQIVRRAPVLPLAAAIAVFAVGCTDSNQPTSPQSGMSGVSTTLTEAELQGATGRGVDREFSRLAKQIPGFGGMYYDKSGRLNVYMKAPAGGAALRSSDVASTLRASGSAAVQRRLSKSADLVTQAAKYDYNELQAYRGRLKKIFTVRGVVFTDTDESANRLRVAITPAAKEQDVVRALAAAGVPRDVVIISRVSAVDRVRPAGSTPASAQRRRDHLPGSIGGSRVPLRLLGGVQREAGEPPQRGVLRHRLTLLRHPGRKSKHAVHPGRHQGSRSYRARIQ